jgi:hypothetical protein
MAVPTNEYVVSLEYGAAINAAQGLWTFCNILLVRSEAPFSRIPEHSRYHAIYFQILPC